MNIFDAQKIVESSGKNYVTTVSTACLNLIYELITEAAQRGETSISLCRNSYSKLPLILHENLRFDSYTDSKPIFSKIEKAVIDGLDAGSFKRKICIEPGFGSFPMEIKYLKIMWHKSPTDNLPHWSDDLS